jgi:hypothetical protein
MGESIRLELVSASREEVLQLEQQIDAKVGDVSGLANELSSKHAKTRSAVKELSMNVAKALGKKLDVKEFRQSNKGQGGHGHSHTHGHSSSSTHSPSKQQRILEQSHRLLPSQSHGIDDCEASGVDSDPNDVKLEFDQLLRSMRERSSSSSSDSDDEDEDNEVAVVNSTATGHGRSPRAFHSSTSHGRTEGASPSQRDDSTMSPMLRYYRQETGGLTAPHPTPSNSRPPSRSNLGTGTPVRESNHANNSDELRSLRGEVATLKLRVAALTANQDQHQHQQSTAAQAGLPTPHQSSKMVELDWRSALGDLSLKLRSEMSLKASRDELQALVLTSADGIEQRVGRMQSVLNGAAKQQALQQLGNELAALRHTVAGEVVGARFLWTSGHLLKDGWVPWDHQV